MPPALTTFTKQRFRFIATETAFGTYIFYTTRVIQNVLLYVSSVFIWIKIYIQAFASNKAASHPNKEYSTVKRICLFGCRDIFTDKCVRVEGRFIILLHAFKNATNLTN